MSLSGNPLSDQRRADHRQPRRHRQCRQHHAECRGSARHARHAGHAAARRRRGGRHHQRRNAQRQRHHLIANAGLVSNVTNPLPNVPDRGVGRHVSAKWPCTGNSAINASGSFSAHAESQRQLDRARHAGQRSARRDRYRGAGHQHHGSQPSFGQRIGQRRRHCHARCDDQHHRRCHGEWHRCDDSGRYDGRSAGDRRDRRSVH